MRRLHARTKRGCVCGSQTACGCGRRREVPPSVQEVLRTDARPLDGAVRTALEPRFGHDFSRVRVHSGVAAAESARAVGARAFTVGSDIVLGEGADTRVLAHELAHVVQQSSGILGSFISSPDDATEREADAAARSVAAGTPMPALRSATLHVARVPITPRRSSDVDPTRALPARAPVAPRGPLDVDPRRGLPARGPNPGDCLTPICSAVQSTPLNIPALHQAVNHWRDASIACIRGGAAASGASHATDIVTNEVTEYTAEASDIINNLHRPDDVRNALRDSCANKQREVELEFRYNVIFDTSSMGGFGGSLSGWDDAEEALRAIPEDATWGSPVTMTFRRGQLAAPNLGETTPSRGLTTATITIDPSAMTHATGGQYATLNLPTSVATIRHEVAHVVQDHTPQAVLDELFDTLLEWKNWTLANVHATPPAHPEWAAQRAEARARAGGSEAEFDAFIATIDAALAAAGARLSTPPVARGGFDWVAKPGGSAAGDVSQRPRLARTGVRLRAEQQGRLLLRGLHLRPLAAGLAARPVAARADRLVETQHLQCSRRPRGVDAADRHQPSRSARFLRPRRAPLHLAADPAAARSDPRPPPGGGRGCGLKRKETCGPRRRLECRS